MRALATWTLRDLAARRGLHAGLLLLVALVTVIVPGGQRAARLLRGTVDGWADRLGLADVEILHGPAIAGAAESVRRLPGVRDAEERLRGPGRVTLPSGAALPALLEMLPPEGPPRLDRVELLEGRYPAPDEVAALVDRSVARWHDVRPGALLTVRLQETSLRVPVVGVVVAAEHPMAPIHPEHALPVRGAVAPVWLTSAALADLPAMRARRTCLLLALEPGAEPRAVARSASALLSAQVLAVVPREQRAAQRFADLLLGVFHAYLPTVEVVLAALAAMLLALTVRRHVRALRGEVALWLALGEPAHRVALGLLLPGALTTLLGAGLGLVGHRAFAFAIHGAIERSMGIAPAIDPGLGPEALGLGAVLLATALMAAGLEAWPLLRQRPARLLREGAHPGGGRAGRLAASVRRLPTPALLGLSHALARPVAAVGLLLALAGMFAALLAFHSVHRSYEVGCIEAVRRSGLDAVVRLEAPSPTTALDDLARRAEGRAEPLLTGLGLLSQGERSGFVQVVGLDAAGWGATLRCWSGRRLAPGADGEVVVDRWVAQRLGLAPGSQVSLHPSESAPEGLLLELVGVVETLSVGRAYVSLAAAQSLYGLPGQVNGAQVASGLPAARLQAALGAAPGVERVLALGGAREEVLATLEGGRVVLRLALLFTALLTATFLAVVGGMDARERLADAAVLHALGWRDRALVAVVGVEMAVRTGLAVGAGLLLAVPLTHRLLQRLGEADLHTLDHHPSPGAPWLLTGMCLVLVPLAMLPACRTLLRVSPSQALKLLSSR